MYQNTLVLRIVVEIRNKYFDNVTITLCLETK